MRQSSLRIRSVRMKATGQVVTVLHPRKNPALVEGHRRMVSDFDYFAKGMAEDGVAGYAIVAWDGEGQTWYQLMVTEGRVVPRALIPSFAKDALNRALSRIENLEEESEPVGPDAS